MDYERVLFMNVEKRANIIIDWIDSYCKNTSFNPKSLVVGVSGGIDSSVVSTLCALTGRKTIVLSMPINGERQNLLNTSNLSAGLYFAKITSENASTTIKFIKN